MCIVCGIFFSGLTLFTPVTEVPDSASSNTTGFPKLQYQKTQINSLAKQAQIKLARMMAQLPISNETHVLRKELKSIQVELAPIKDDAKAQEIVKTRLRTIYQRILEKPSYQQEFNVFMKLIEVKSEQQAMNSLELNLAQNTLAQNTSDRSSLFAGHGKSWGWIQ